MTSVQERSGAGPVLVLAPASLKGVLDAPAAAAALAGGVATVVGVRARAVPVADGGEGTAEAIAGVRGGTWRAAAVHGPLGEPVEARYLVLDDGTAVVECAEAIGLGLVPPEDRDPLQATSAGLGELLLAALDAGASRLLVGLGGSATVDGGAGLLAVVGNRLHGVPLQVACDVRSPLLGERGAARAFGPQKGADPSGVEELERRLATMSALAPYAHLPGAGAAGGLGAALASLGGILLPGGELVLEALGFDQVAAGAALVVTGEGMVDRTTAEGKAPRAVAAACARSGVRCVVFGGRVVEPLPGVETRALSGDPGRAREDLHALGRALALELAGD